MGAYRAAIDAGADFLALTDHVSAWNAYKGLAMDPGEWEDRLAAADYYTSSDFVAMAGYEAWLLGHLGEINVYNVRDLPPAKPLRYRHDRLPIMYNWLPQQPAAIGQFNHPYYMTNDFEEHGYCTDSRGKAMSILELRNTRSAEDS